MANISDLMESLAFSKEIREDVLKICAGLDLDKLAEAAALLRTKKARIEKIISDKGIIEEVKKIMSELKALSEKYGILS